MAKMIALLQQKLVMKEIVKLVISVVSIAYAGICTLVSVIKSVKAKDKQILIEELTAEIIPLMEQAEQAFDTGEERELWVVKKLGEKLHIDFYKYKKILKIVLTKRFKKKHKDY